jgi:eukaryotic-like serine/threonine-protein kinase
MAESPCPPEDRLRLLLSGGSTLEQGDLVAHLDSCPECRLTLERLADTTHDLLDVARGVGRVADTHFAEDSLRRLLAALEEHGPTTTAEMPAHAIVSAETIGRLDGYQVTGLLGQGAMGQVLAAFDPALHRKVAVKILAPNLAGDPVARERFAREARAAAAVKHEHVVTIHAVRETGGLPYLVMEHLAGGSLQDYLERHGALDWRVAARLGAEIAEGLAAAHAAGLIHRDIKPSNILLETSSPGEPGTAKIGDFGLARIADESRLTATGILAGTPVYMAPEQALGEPLDGRADLFSLGSVLYTLCTGREPFSGANPMAVLRRVCEAKPVPIRELCPAVPSWLADLVERLHAKSPARRLASAAEVAALIRHDLAHPDEPRRLPKLPPLPRRKSFRVLGAALLVVLLIAAAIGLRWLALPGAGPLPLRATLSGHTGPIWAVAFSLDGQTVVTGSDDTTLCFWEATTGQPTGRISDQGSAVYSVAFARAGQLVVTGRDNGSLQVWDVATRVEQPVLPHAGGNTRRLAISPDGKTLAVGSSTQGVELWDFDRRTLRLELPGHHTTLLSLAFSPDNRAVATGDASGLIRLWEPATGAEKASFQGDSLGLRALAFSPDGRTLASAGTGDKDVKLWDVSTQREVARFGRDDNGFLNLAFSPRGEALAAGGRDGTVRLWEVPSGRVLTLTPAHQGSVWALAFSPDGKTLATVGEDRLGKLWDLPDP